MTPVRLLSSRRMPISTMRAMARAGSAIAALRASDDGCTEIDLPDNAHLDRSGNRWECHKNFQRSQGRCVLND
jgi:hypothetical protein